MGGVLWSGSCKVLSKHSVHCLTVDLGPFGWQTLEPFADRQQGVLLDFGGNSTDDFDSGVLLSNNLEYIRFSMSEPSP